MGDAERSAFMSQAKGAICVVYRLPMRIGAALALTLSAPAFGQDAPPADASMQQAAAPCEIQAEREAAPDCIVVTGGTVREPANVQWTEDVNLPELPTAPDDGASHP
jgi:hypothetical protein